MLCFMHLKSNVPKFTVLFLFLAAFNILKQHDSVHNQLQFTAGNDAVVTAALFSQCEYQR